MANLTIRNLDDDIKTGLRLRAARHGHSMEEEARRILARAIQAPDTETGLGARIHDRFEALGGIDLPLVPRSPPRTPPDFSGGGTS
jgi:plasmid stability protein